MLAAVLKWNNKATAHEMDSAVADHLKHVPCRAFNFVFFFLFLFDFSETKMQDFVLLNNHLDFLYIKT